MRRFALLFACLAAGSAYAQIGQPGNPFAPPEATVHYAPDRDYDLKHVDVSIDVDWPHRAFTGVAIDTLAPLRSGLDHITLDAGANLKIETVSIDGRSMPFRHDGAKLFIDSGPMAKGRNVSVTISYDSLNAAGRGFGQGGSGGWHWISTRLADTSRVGFWTQGETMSNSNWVPLWDYPNDFITSETHTTVPADWTVIGNGNLISNRLNKDRKTRTFDWKMPIPHATYLLSLCGGPFDVRQDEWRGVPLWYVVPKGEGYLIPGSFGHTPDMLSFYSDILGYKFPWPKYAQDAMYDFGGGMENASATTLGEPSLTDSRSGFYNMDSLNSHELGHQWFGDTVTCKDWGQIWLNESFATYMQIMYFEHSRGPNGYAREVENAMQSYFGEARRYHRPIVTNLYSNADAMFDSHTYPKGGVVLHTLRKMLGDESFFAGLHLYLNTHQHTPVETNDLCEAFGEASGINCHPFFDQWIFKPGHPVIDSNWSWDDAAKKVIVHVKQTQNTSDGTPIYTVKTAVGIIDGTHLDEAPVTINEKEQDLVISRAAKPSAVLFDPEHNFLREIPEVHWDRTELPYILKTAPNCVDRNRAFRMMLSGAPSDDDIDEIVAVLKADNSPNPAIESFFQLSQLKKESLRPFFLSELNHPSILRRAQAVEGLGELQADASVTDRLRSLIAEDEPYPVVNAAMQVLARWDLEANMDVMIKASHLSSMRNLTRNRALTILTRAHTDKARASVFADAAPGQPADVRITALNALVENDAAEPRTLDAVRTALRDKDGLLLVSAVRGASALGNKILIPDLQSLIERPDLPDAEAFKPVIQAAIKTLQGS